MNHIYIYMNHIYIQRVSPQLSCGDTCQIGKWHLIVNFADTNMKVTERRELTFQ